MIEAAPSLHDIPPPLDVGKVKMRFRVMEEVGGTVTNQMRLQRFLRKSRPHVKTSIAGKFGRRRRGGLAVCVGLKEAQVDPIEWGITGSGNLNPRLRVRSPFGEVYLRLSQAHT